MSGGLEIEYVLVSVRDLTTCPFFSTTLLKELSHYKHNYKEIV